MSRIQKTSIKIDHKIVHDLLWQQAQPEQFLNKLNEV